MTRVLTHLLCAQASPDVHSPAAYTRLHRGSERGPASTATRSSQPYPPNLIQVEGGISQKQTGADEAHFISERKLRRPMVASDELGYHLRVPFRMAHRGPGNDAAWHFEALP